MPPFYEWDLTVFSLQSHYEEEVYFLPLSSPKQNIWKPSEIFEMADMLICRLQLKMESKTECPFSIYRLFIKIKH